MSLLLTPTNCLVVAIIFMPALWISLASTQCSSADSACAGYWITRHLGGTPAPKDRVTATCIEGSRTGRVLGWTILPYAGDIGSDIVLLDTTLSKYMVTELSYYISRLTITDINATDEGFLRCVFENRVYNKHCIFIYGRAVFKSCPANDCSIPTRKSIYSGSNVNFDANVIFVDGGGCGFQQEVTNVQLVKIKPQFEDDDEIILSCDITATGGGCRNSRASLHRGIDLRSDFSFTLNDVLSKSDAGMYKVIISASSPQHTNISKQFLLEAIDIPAPVNISAFCSYAVWHNPPVVLCSDIKQYQIRVSNSKLNKTSLIKVAADRTFYFLSHLDDDDFIDEDTTFEVGIVTAQAEGELSEPISLGCHSPPPSVYFELNGVVHLNNSLVTMTDIGEGDRALLCKTDKADCCVSPNWFGKFYYPNGTEVLSQVEGQAFYRDRSNQQIRLDRHPGLTQSQYPTGEYRCEIPDSSNENQNVFVTIQ